MTITPHNLQNESPTDELAMLLVGDYKSGKSRLAGTAPGNVLFLEFDRRLAALRTHPNVKNIYGLEFADDLNSSQSPTAINEMLTVLNNLEKSSLLRDVHETFKSANDKLVDTIVFDSIQTMADASRSYIMYNAPDVAKTFTMGSKRYRVAASYHAWGGEMEMVTGAILQARALLHCKVCNKSVTHSKDGTHHTDKSVDHIPEPRAMNVICILHECMEQDERSTQENPIYTGKIEVYPRRYNTLLKYFNEVWRLTRDAAGPPVVHVDPDGKFVQAATALGLPKITVPDISQVLRDVKSMQKPVQTQITNKGQ